MDASGNLYVSNAFIPSVVEIKPIGGYYISPVLPAGLHFDSNTGAISGTPTVNTAAKNYVVTAYNLGGGSTTTINIKTSPLTLSYVSPQSYAINTPITPLLPTYSGLATAGYGTSPSVLASGLSTPLGVAVDATGNVYLADAGTRNISKIPTAGGAPIVEGSGFTVPYGVAVDILGNIYMTDNSANNVKKIPYNGGPPIIIGAGFNGPNGVAVDASGNVYIGDAGSGTVKKIPAAGGAVITIASGFNYPAGVAVDSTGNVYVADQLNSAIKMIPAGGGAPVTLGSGFHQPTGVAVDAAGNVFVADQLNNAIKEIPAGGGAVISIGSGFNQPYGVCVDGAGNVYVGDAGTGTVKKITPVGGFYINALPLGLTFSNASGAIGGTPKVISPATNYTVTAYNSMGNNSAVVNIKITPPAVATLSNLALSSGSLTPVFASGTTVYIANVGNGITSITLTPTATDPLGTIKVNGTTVATGAASSGNALTVGANIITTVVTAQDGITTKTYALTVTRAASANANLSQLKLSSGALSPVFSAVTTGYTVDVSNAVSSMTVTPTTGVATSSVTVNGTAVTSGSASGAINLNVGPNTITTVVTAQDGTTTKTYTITVIKAGSGNANLSKLGPGISGLTPAFSSGTTSYTISTGNTTASMTLTPVSSDANATIKVNGTTVTSGTVTAPVILAEGAQTVISTVVTAQDGSTTKTYTLTVARAVSTNASLSALKLSSGTLTPAFAPATTSYAVSVANTVSTITISPATTDANATIKVNGAAVASGTASTLIALVEGAQTVITTVVTAQNGATTKTYTLTVTRAPSTNAALSKLGPNIGGLTPAFSSTTTSYTISTGNATAAIKLTPVSSDANATIQINGTAVASGTTTAPIALAVGPNTITAVVTAQDGTTIKTYTLTVTRASGGADSYVPIAIGTGISVTIPIAIGTTETPALADDGVQVHQGVSPNGDGINDFLQIDNISQYPDNKLMIMNRNGQLIYEASGYDNSSKVFDGHSNKNGRMQLPGTYFYQLDYTVNGVAKHKTGFLVLKY